MSFMEEDVQGTWRRAAPVRWKMTCRPGSCQTPNRCLAPQGWWGDKQERGEGEAGECAAGWMTSVTPCFRFPWRRDLTPPTPFLSLPHWCSSHSPRTHGMVADRRGRWAGLSSFAAPPHSCFLTFCPPHLQDKGNVYITPRQDNI